jgi:poly-gamma-glutamate system protein
VQKLYWRPAQVYRGVYVLIAVIAVAALIAVEVFRVNIVQPHFEQKMEAARLMLRGMEVIRLYRVRKVGPIDPEADPANSGLIGLASSSTTTNTGALDAKRTTVNPNWAAVVVDLLHRAGVQQGDLVALGFSGSFPALNLAALCAAEVMKLDAVPISSAGASSWGANVPNFGWLDMERILQDAGVITQRSVAASLGGTGDRAQGLSRSARRRLRLAIDRAKIPYLETQDDLSSIEKRMTVYEEKAGGRRYAAYVNAGGSLVSIGPRSVKRLYQPGLNLGAPRRAGPVDSVMKRFLDDGVPVVNLSKVVPLAESYGLPIEPQEIPPVGEGDVFQRREYSRPLVAGALGGLLLVLYGLLRLEFGSRLVAIGGRSQNRQIEPMV